MKKIIFIIALLFINIASFGHALWIETAANGKKGQAQEVKIFFGEYGGTEIDSAKKWFSNLKNFSLVLTAPDGKTQVLTASADILNYKTSFTPTQDGVYRLSIVHEVADIYEHAKIEYYAFADVLVGNDSKTNHAYPAGALLTLKPEKPIAKANVPVPLQVSFKKKPLAKTKLTVIGPDKKSTAPETDGNGKLNFEPKANGNYFLEAFTEEKTPGTLAGKAYEKVWHVTTYFISIP